MRLFYYADTDSLYVEFEDRPSVDTREIAPDISLDLDQKGRRSGHRSRFPIARSERAGSEGSAARERQRRRGAQDGSGRRPDRPRAVSLAS